MARPKAFISGIRRASCSCPYLLGLPSRLSRPRATCCHLICHSQHQQNIHHQRRRFQGFPGGAVDRNLLANAEDTGWLLGLRRFHMLWSKEAHLPQLLSLCATTTEAWGPKALCSTTREATAVGSPHTTMERSPCSLQLEKPCTQQQRPSAAKNKQMF